MPLRNLLAIFVASIASFATYSVAVTNHSYEARVTEAMEMVQRESLIEKSKEELFDAMMSGMMQSLDEHSMYFAGKDAEEFDNDLKQQFGGVGMYVDINPSNQRLTVMSPIPNTPAHEAGARTGDIIDEIDGQSTKSMTRADAVKLMRGPIDTNVNVTFLRGEERIEATLTRKMIPVPSVRGDRRNADASWNHIIDSKSKIGYVQIIQFGDKTTEELETVLNDIDSKTEALIIDLRNNTGGYMTSALEICNMFLDGKYKIIETRRRGGRLDEEYYSKRGVLYGSNKPVVVLVNRFSASASEIVSACLQDHKRAVLIGEKTYGKGTVQNVIPFDDGRAFVKLTIASYWRPSGENIDRSVSEARGDADWGVKPNNGFEIELDEDQLFQNMRTRNQRGALIAPDQNENDPNAQENLPDVPDASEDPVMKKALEYLRKVLGKAAAA